MHDKHRISKIEDYSESTESLYLAPHSTGKVTPPATKINYPDYTS